MNRKIVSLTLAGTLSLALLAGCSSPDGGESTPPAATPPVESVTPSPSLTPAPEPTLPPVDELPVAPETGDPDNLPADPDASLIPDEVEKPSATPKPSASQKPEPAPSQEPAPSETPEESESPAPETSAVQSVWNEVSDLERPSLMDLDDSLLTDLYGIDPADLEEYIGKMPLMSAHVTEFLIAKAAPGKADVIEQACQDRQTALSSNNQYPSNTALVDGYKIVVNGDYVLFCIDEYADQMVEAFNTYTK